MSMWADYTFVSGLHGTEKQTTDAGNDALDPLDEDVYGTF